LANFVAFLTAGGTVEQVAAAMMGSPEYFQVRGGGTNGGFLSAVYSDLLNRMIDPRGLATFTQALANGITRSQVAAAILGSPEYLQLLLQGFYRQFLQRYADLTCLIGFFSALQNGVRDEEVIASFLSSAEYAAVRVG